MIKIDCNHLDAYFEKGDLIQQLSMKSTPKPC